MSKVRFVIKTQLLNIQRIPIEIVKENWKEQRGETDGF